MRTFLPGFSLRRMAWYVGALSLAMPFCQLFTPCRASGAVAEAGMCLAALMYPLCLLLPSQTQNRFAPVLAGAIAFILNIASVH